MVYPVYKAVLKVGTNGRSSMLSQMVIVRDMEKIEITLDETTQEWSSLTESGWARRLKTGKSMTVSVSGKRNYGDAGNDYIASIGVGDADAGQSVIIVEFPDGGKITMPCVIEVEDYFGGSGDDVAGISFKCRSDGKVSYTKA